jgi:hypothetical protein
VGKQFSAIDPAHRRMITATRIFFTASAATMGRVNLSPRPTDGLRVIDARTVAYLDLTGSGNETAAHVHADGRLTFMFCAFEGPPAILRLYGHGRILARASAEYQTLLRAEFDGVEPPGARQIVVLDVDLVQTSCGYGVPLFDYRGERTTLTRWAEHKGEAALERYRREKNARSIDGLPTGLLDEASALVSESVHADI